jgi:hypothetical protein
VFGLPDLQCHCHDLELPRLAAYLRNAGNYIFERGDVIRDGDTIERDAAGEKWRCLQEKALIPPGRLVIDLDPASATRRGSGSADRRPWRRRPPPAHTGRSTILPGTPWPAACRFNGEGNPPLQPPRPRTHRHRAVSIRRSRGFASRRGVRPLLPAAEAGSPRLAVSAGLHFARR